MKQIIVFAAFLILCGSSAQSKSAGNLSVQPTDYLEHYLNSMGKKLGCYFTIEARPPIFEAKQTAKGRKLVFLKGISPHPNSPLWYTMTKVPNDPRPTSIGQLVILLQKELPDTDVTQDKGNPTIVHLFDEELLEDKAYIMNRKTTITYSGLLAGLPNALGKKLDAPIDGTGIGPGEWFYFDSVTKVNVLAQNKTVRDILSSSIPLAAYSHVLWRATTQKVAEGYRTDVAFYGPNN